MTDAKDRRAALLDRLADHLLAHGLAGASLRPMAKAAGTSDRMLLYYFPDKAALLQATLQHLAARLTGMLDAHRAPAPVPPDTLLPRLIDMALAPDVWPYMRLWLDLAAAAAQGDPAARTTGHAIAQGFLDWLAPQLDAPEGAAMRLLVTVEGTVLLHALGVDAR